MQHPVSWNQGTQYERYWVKTKLCGKDGAIHRHCSCECKITQSLLFSIGHFLGNKSTFSDQVILEWISISTHEVDIEPSVARVALGKQLWLLLCVLEGSHIKIMME